MNTNTTPNPDKKMFKVLYPVEKKGGGTAYWMRLGSAFTAKDGALNVYLDAMPASNSGRYQLYIRELDAEDLRRRESHNSSRSSSSNGYGHDLGGIGGIGGGPTASSRAVTASSSLSGNEPDGERIGTGTDDVPF